jgi:hypothetical protein
MLQSQHIYVAGATWKVDVLAAVTIPAVPHKMKVSNEGNPCEAP